MTNEEFLKSISVEGEEWRSVVGYEGYFVVSNMDRIASLKHSVKKRKRIKDNSTKAI